MQLQPLKSLTATMRPVDLGTTARGQRIDLELDGSTEQDSGLEGHLTGTDYLTVRSDGVLELNVHATLTRPEGDVVSLTGFGLATRGSDGAAHGRLALTFHTAAPALHHLNEQLGVAVTVADMAQGTLHIRGFLFGDA